MIRKVLAISAATVLVAGCTSAEDNSTPTGPIAVTATTNVWGSIAEFIGGDMVEVTSIVDQPTIDPHSYEPSARDLLAVQDAEMVLVNGGGYDAFMESLIDQAEGTRVVLRAVAGENSHDHSHDDDEHSHDGEDHSHQGEDHSHEGEDHSHEEDKEHSHEDEDHAHEGEDHSHEGDDHSHEGDDHSHDHSGHSHAEGNEHVWYDFHVVEEVADQLLASLTQLRPDSAGDFQANHQTFVDELEVLEVRLEALRENALGYGVFSITPLASIMMEDAGFEEMAPKDLLEAVEEERDISPTSIAEAEAVFEDPDLLMVITNDQVTDTQMQSIAEMAESKGLPVVGLGELIPNEDWDYLDWMANNLDVLMATVDQQLPEQIEN